MIDKTHALDARKQKLAAALKSNMARRKAVVREVETPVPAATAPTWMDDDDDTTSPLGGCCAGCR